MRPLNTSMIQTVSEGSGSILTLQEAKTHCRVNISDEDDYMTDLISAAQDYIQQETGIRFYADVYKEFFPCFHSRMDLMRYPVSSVASVKYYTSDVLTTLASSQYSLQKPTNSQAWIYFETFPGTDYRPDAVVIQYTTGITPSPIVKQAARLLVGHFYSNRENETLFGISSEIAIGVTNLLRKVDRRSYI